jgi:uncharacterized protein (DUF2236 family)
VPYNAFDRDLQLRVAACLAFGALDLQEKLGGQLPADEAEWYYRELRRLGTTLQVAESDWPPDVAAFRTFWESGIARVEYDDTVRAYLDRLLDLRQLPAWQRRPLARFHRFVNTGFLPSLVRERMLLPWSPADQARFDRLLVRTARLNRMLPARIRCLPFTMLLANLRLRIRSRRRLV